MSLDCRQWIFGSQAPKAIKVATFSWDSTTLPRRAKRVHLCACHACHGGLWNWGPQMYWPHYFEPFLSLSRPIAQRDLIGSSASSSCSTRLGWLTSFASPSFFDGTWSSHSPHTFARISWSTLLYGYLPVGPPRVMGLVWVPVLGDLSITNIESI